LTESEYDIRSAASNFRIDGSFLEGAPYGSGHINDTYAVVYDQNHARVRYIVQRINHNVFKNPAGLQENVERVTRHMFNKLVEQGVEDVSRRTLTLIPALDDKSYYVDPDGNYWRAYVFIDGASTYDQIETTEQAYEAAKVYGRFQELVCDLPGPRLFETIPDFHNTRTRFDAFKRAVDEDSHGRSAGVTAEIDYALGNEWIVDVLLDLQKSGDIPERITHNDTKLNNVMIDDETAEGLCVIDLDTVMPGLSLYDFGDMVRSGARSAPEDEPDLGKVVMRMDMFEALARGYLASAGAMLNEAEKDHLVFSGTLITFEQGLRFLTDYLRGDVYYKTHRKGHNLDRSRVQFKMVESMAEQDDDMRRVVDEIRAEQSKAV